MSADPFLVYVGYDVREHLAWLVCESSLRWPTCAERGGPAVDCPVEVIPLSHRRLRREGKFDRSWRIDEQGVTWDERDGRPFSTEFSHSRFLVPGLALEKTAHRPRGKGWAMFVDCDFLFRRPVTDLLHGLDPNKAVYVVKHDFDRVAEGVKMDGCVQQRYYRKLWSSLVIWNLDHPKVQAIDWAERVATCPGAALHAFEGFDDDEIGGLSEAWNWIPGHSTADVEPAAVHWSLGGPWMSGFENAPYADEWDARMKRTLTTITSLGHYGALAPIL